MKMTNLLFLLLVFLVGCRTKYVPIENKTNHEIRTSMNDTVFVKDSVFNYTETNTITRNDTVFVDRTIYVYKEKQSDGRHYLDTIISVKDTVTVYQLSDGTLKYGTSTTWGALYILIVLIVVVWYLSRKKKNNG